MPDDSLPDAVAQFMARHIATMEELEILLLLAKDKTALWTAEATYQVVKSSRASVEQGLRKFVTAGLATAVQDGYSIAPQADLLLLEQVSRAYRGMPVRVIEAIYQRPRDAAQDFADAFKLKRNP
jgi:hypothetical protein